MKYVSILCLLALTACMSPEQVEAARQAQEQADADTCYRYGFRPETDAFSNCMLQIAISREQMAYEYYYPPQPYFYGGYYHHWH